MSKNNNYDESSCVGDWDEKNNVCWAYDNLEIREDGAVVGEAISAPLEGPNTQNDEATVVRVSVSSNELGDRYDEDRNYIPYVVVEGKEGSILHHSEPTQDYKDPEEAIKEAKSIGGYLFNNFDTDKEKLI